jgi:chromosome segregation ATPase
MPEIPSRYYAYTKKSIRGPFTSRDITQLPGFSKNTLVCPENALGQWREAAQENVFQNYFDALPDYGAPEKPKPPVSAAQTEGAALRSLLEKGIAKNAALENEVRTLRREYMQEKKRFEEDSSKKDSEIKNLVSKLKRSNEAASGISTEHPSWEMLYKTLKKRSEEKLFEATQALSEKTGEIIRLKNQMQSMVDNYEVSKRKNSDEETNKVSAVKEQLNNLTNQLEEKEMVVLTMNDNMSSLLGKNEEFQRIMLDERHDYEEQSKKFCEEIGALRSELTWKTQETVKIREELAETLNRLKEFEATENIKTREQEELYGILHSKIKILSGYFENLESRVKYIFKKA